MRAIRVKAAGGPDMLELCELPEPNPASHEVLIEVHASALNRADLLQRRGLYPPPPGESELLGLECAGIVRAVGRETSRFQVGARVMALLGGGGYAEAVRVHENLVMPIPERLSFQAAAAVPEAFLTAYEALFAAAELAPGERALIHAAGSGVGLAALQVARELGAEVSCTVRSPAKAERLKTLGAARVVCTGSDDFAAVVERESGGRGVDVIVDLVGAAYAAQNQRILAPAGRWVVVGLLGGAKASIDFGSLLMKRQTLRGIVMRSRPLPEKTAIVRGFLNDLWHWLDAGRLEPVVDRVFPLAEAAAAHAHLEANASFGKVVLSVRD
ncbi:MAG: NAD(P)H-quinone oxidoreductase [Polyangiaceae bacterium]